MVMETFSLVEHIAFDCVTGGGIEVTARTQTDCAFHENNVWLFTDAIAACRQSFYDAEGNPKEDLVDIYGDFNGYVSHFTNSSHCYNAFTNGVAFGS